MSTHANEIPAGVPTVIVEQRATPGSRVGAVRSSLLLPVLIASVIVTVLFLTARPGFRSGAVDTTGAQRIWLIGTNDPARLQALENNMCTFDGSRYRSPACRPFEP
jgi:hypothetical protein